jgi:DNA/RNA-binding domain of Phe-tRNA-synthetase-like protein
MRLATAAAMAFSDDGPFSGLSILLTFLVIALIYATINTPSRKAPDPAFMPVVAPEIFTLRPDFRALSIRAQSVANSPGTPETAAALVTACKAPCSEPWAEGHREAWREAYRAFGAKPQRTPCSAEALLKRVARDGTLPSVNAVVDLYNAVSLRFAIPVGGENAAAYAGVPHLAQASGSEPFETMQAGTPVIETAEPGEVIWRDEVGVTCRRWNWRQGTRTRIDAATTQMWFILEALGPMPDAALMIAGTELTRGLRLLSPRSDVEVCLLTRSGSTHRSLNEFV